jgi:hypothetical protein
MPRNPRQPPPNPAAARPKGTPDGIGRNAPTGTPHIGDTLSCPPVVCTAPLPPVVSVAPLPPIVAGRLPELGFVEPTRAADPEQPALAAHVMRRKVTKRTLKHLHEIANAAAEFDRLPERDESIHCLMRGNFHGWDIVPAVLHLAKPATITALYVATLGFNKQNATELVEMIDAGKIRRVVFVCSCYFQKANPGEFELLRNGLAQRGHTVVATRSHAKILAMQLDDGRAIVTESSANLRSCRNIEQVCMTESPELFAFHRFWIDEVAQQCLASKPSR